MFNTNATLLSKKTLEIIKAKPDLVIFSVDSPDKESYEKQRIGANYEQVDKNVRRFVKTKNKIRPKIITRAHMVYTEETKRFIPDHIARWSGIADEITINSTNKYCEKLTSLRFKCRAPYRRLDITCDGSVYLCDPDFDPRGRFLLGNANNQTIHEIWHSDKINKIREIFNKQAPQLLDPCKYCHGV